MIKVTRKECINYTWQHKKAFLKVEKKLLGKNTLRGYLHDLDKIFLYIPFGMEKGHNIHTWWARHHQRRANTRKDYIEMIIDWECARITKPDKPLDAYDTLYKFYPNKEKEILPLLKELNLAR